MEMNKLKEGDDSRRRAPDEIASDYAGQLCRGMANVNIGTSPHRTEVKSIKVCNH